MNNDDIDNVEILPLLDTGYVRDVIQEGRNAVFYNGRLAYIILDIDKPGKYFFDLRSVFNGSTGEGGKDLNIMFLNNDVPWQLNGKTIGVDGAYPSGERFHVTGTECQANSSVISFNFPLGFFQEAGIYKFQFEIRDEAGNLATSHYCFFQVTQNATLLAADFKNGVNPYDSDYTEWKNKVEQGINALTGKLNNLNEAADQLEQLMNSYIAKAEGYVDQAVQNAIGQALNKENTWTMTQHFNDGLTFQDNAVGDILSVKQAKVSGDTDTAGLNVSGSATLPSNTTIGGVAASSLLLVQNISGNVVLLNGTSQCNAPSEQSKNWWLWVSRINMRSADYPLYVMHFNLVLDTSDVGKPIAQFDQSAFAGTPDPGGAQAVLGGQIQFHVDTQGQLILDGVNGISGKNRYRFTAVF